MKVKIVKGNYFYHPPKGKDGRKYPVVVVPAGGEVDVSEAEAKRLALLGVGEIVPEAKPSSGEKSATKRNSKPKSESEAAVESEAPELGGDDEDIVV